VDEKEFRIEDKFEIAIKNVQNGYGKKRVFLHKDIGLPVERFQRYCFSAFLSDEYFSSSRGLIYP
jgi:hypothetical protein